MQANPPFECPPHRRECQRINEVDAVTIIARRCDIVRCIDVFEWALATLPGWFDYLSNWLGSVPTLDTDALSCAVDRADTGGVVGAAAGGAVAVSLGSPIFPKSWMPNFLPNQYDGRVGFGGGGPTGRNTSVISAMSRGFLGREGPSGLGTKNFGGMVGQVASRASVATGVGLEVVAVYQLAAAYRECSEEIPIG